MYVCMYAWPMQKVWLLQARTESRFGVDAARVTRLGEFSPNWAIVFFGQLLDNRRSQNCRVIFPTEKSYIRISFDKKTGRASLWAIFHKLIWSPWMQLMFHILCLCMAETCSSKSLDKCHSRGD
jgi:hypothetical protein